jgi:hypothetical protein
MTVYSGVLVEFWGIWNSFGEVLSQQQFQHILEMPK